MLRKLIFLFLFTIIFTSCSRQFAVFVKVLDFDSPDLKMDFSFKDKTLQEEVNISSIKIYNNDSLLYELEMATDTSFLSSWLYPELPKGFKIVFPENESSIRKFSTQEHLNFTFLGYWKNAGGLGTWHYKPSYLKKENRWMFDSDGTKNINVESSYESWLGKDLIKIYSDGNLNIDTETVTVTGSQNENIDFKIKSSNKSPHLLILTLEKDLKKNEIFELSFNTVSGNRYSDKIKVGKKSNIGIIGKYQ